MKTLFRTALTGAALMTAIAACTSTTGSAGSASSAVETPPVRQRLEPVRLVSYESCDDMLAGLREHAAANVSPYGFGGPTPMYMMRGDTAQAKTAEAPEHSTTNVYEAGVDEPDLVKTDGNRLITVTAGTLRVIDTATRKVTASLKLTKDGESNFAPADLLVSGDRALVLFKGGDIMYKTFAPVGETRYVVVDLSAEPKVVGSVKPQGSFVDARMVGTTVRLVTRSEPAVEFPTVKDDATDAARKQANAATVRKAPISAWQPTIEITDAAGKVTKQSVPCDRVSHPADYTGTSLLTVHSIDLSQALTGTDPITLAADGDTVYGTGQSLYVASNPRWWWPVIEPPVDTTTDATADATAQAPATGPDPAEPSPSIPPEETEVHRFDVSKPGAPAYVASGKVPGRLLNQYSLSEYDGNLRVATTLSAQDQKSSTSSVHVLDAGSLAERGEVGGLGDGERIYSVRFIGPVGYCVTFKQVDPLYTLDLRDPTAPKVTGELKITGYSAYLHPGNAGRLIGIGQEASDQGKTLGTQVSLFDVSDPANPRRLSQLFQKDSGSEAEWDPHAFLYWPKTGLSVLPMTISTQNTWQSGAVVLKIDDQAVTRVGMIEHPVHKDGVNSYQPGIQRSMVIGDSIWTMSYDGVQVNDATSLARQAWIPLT